MFDDAGQRYLDGTAGLWYANLGHGRPEIAEAVERQLRTLDTYSIFGDIANEPALELAERLSALAPIPDSKVFLGSGGGDMIEGAAKIARSYYAHRGETSRVHLIGRHLGYHGTHGIGTSVGGIPQNAAGFGTIVADSSHVPHDDAEALEAEIIRIGPDACRRLLLRAGDRRRRGLAPEEGYIERVAEICARHGVLFVADCVICGFGRLGTWLGIDRWSVRPDMITLAKGVTGGTLPLGALIVAPHVAEPFWTGEAGAPMLRHGQTYAGHPTCCAAANAALDIYRDEGVIERGRTLEEPLAQALAPLRSNPLVFDVRAGLGFLAAVEVVDEVFERDPLFVYRWQHACREIGLLVRPLGRGVAVSPPLICDHDDIAFLGERIATGLDRAAAAVAA